MNTKVLASRDPGSLKFRCIFSLSEKRRQNVLFGRFRLFGRNRSGKILANAFLLPVKLYQVSGVILRMKLMCLRKLRLIL